MLKKRSLFLFAAAAVVASQALAQETVEDVTAEEIQDIAADDGAIEDAATTPAVDEDNMADTLNSRQQLQQTFTLKRTVNGEVIETDKRTVTYDRSDPYRETEAGKTTVEQLREKFDGEALTRTEAFEEAKLDFVIADVDRDGRMTAQEFANLVDTWRKTDARQADAPTEEIARQRNYDAFLEEIDPDTAEQQTEAYALQKFAFMAGAAESLSLQDYIRELMLDFDSMDADKDTILQGEELMRFRALNRGETIE